MENKPVKEKPNLMLSDEEICEAICGMNYKGCVGCTVKFETAEKVLKAELNHLAKLGIVYVKETENVDKCSYNGESHCTATSPDDCEDRDSCEPYVSTRYIPLSDYMKGEVK